MTDTPITGRSYPVPPVGWFSFGSHVDHPDLCLERSAETGEDGPPLWERPIEQDKLVNIVDLGGEDYERAVDAANERGGSVDAVIAYLAQWDYGDENDNAAEVNGYTDLAELGSLRHQLHEGDHGGLHYWLVLDHGLGFYSLYRRPLG